MLLISFSIFLQLLCNSLISFPLLLRSNFLMMISNIWKLNSNGRRLGWVHEIFLAWSLFLFEENWIKVRNEKNGKSYERKIAHRNYFKLQRSTCPVEINFGFFLLKTVFFRRNILQLNWVTANSSSTTMHHTFMLHSSIFLH